MAPIIDSSLIGLQDEYCNQSSNFVKLAFIGLIRTLLKSKGIPEKFKYSDTKEGRKVWVYRAFPNRTTWFPVITVTTDEVDMDIGTLGEEVVAIDYEDETKKKILAKWFGGVNHLQVTVEVTAETTTDCEQLVDLLAVYIRAVFRSSFYRVGIEYLSVKGGDTLQEVVNNKVVYKGAIKVICQQQYKYKVDWITATQVSKINLNTFMGTSEEDMTETPKP
jgi:hypothetical protein